jgi:fatty acid desaturase
MTGNYRDLRDLLAREGLFERQPAYYALVITGTLVSWALCLWIFTWAAGPVALTLNTCFFAFVSVQFGFLMHDAGHRAIFREGWKNDVVGVIAGNVLNGISYGWWAPHHTRHHAHPNHDDLDPDLPTLRIALALSEEEARAVRGWKRLVVKHQVLVFPFLFPMQTLALKFFGVRYLVTNLSGLHALELAIIVLHHAAYAWFLVHYLGPWPALAVASAHHVLAGTHLSTVLGTNHIARPFAQQPSADPFLDQVEPSRNVLTHPLFECMWGSLNHQIEHHLFPSMSRNQIRRSLPIVRQFCIERGVHYEEVTLVACYREIVRRLGVISAAARKPNGRDVVEYRGEPMNQ